MRKFNIMSLLLAVVGVLSFASCQHEYADWTPGEKDSNMGVYFANTDDFVVSQDDTFVNIEVKRIKTDAAANITLRAEDVSSSGFFTIPETVSFDAGADSATLKVEFDGANLTPGVQYAIRIKLQESEASAYAVSENIFKIGIPEPWMSLGKGIYRDDFLSPMYGGPAGVMVEVEIVQHEIETNRYRMVEPYSQAMCPYIIGGVPEDMTFTGPGYVEFIVDENGNVEIPSSPLGFKLDVGTGQLEDFYLASLYADENTPMYGKFEDGVFWFTTPNSIMWHIPDGRGNYANQSGLFAVALPGYEISDYSISAAYGGMVVEADNSTTSAVVNFTVGADVETYKFTVLPGNVTDIAPVIEGIVAGSEELTIFESSADELTWKLTLEPASLYTLVAVPYAEDAEVADAISYQFYFPGVGGQELPDPEFSIYYQSLSSLTGEDYEAEYPEAYYVGLGIVGNGDEMKSIKVWIGDAAVVAGSGLESSVIVDNYGSDISQYIENIKAKGSVILGPYNMPSGTTTVALVAIETVYGSTKYYHVEHEMPNATGFALGTYNLSDSLDGEEYGLGINLTGGYAPGQLIIDVEGFQFLGLVDAENGEVVFDGYEVNNEKDIIFNDFAFYYDEAKTMAFGYFVASDAELSTPADLTFSFEGDKLTTLDTYFASCVFSMEDESFLGYDFYFSPAATVEYTEASAPATSAMKASAQSIDTELDFTIKADFNVNTIKAEVYNGKVNRQFVNNATFGF